MEGELPRELYLCLIIPKLHSEDILALIRAIPYIRRLLSASQRLALLVGPPTRKRARGRAAMDVCRSVFSLDFRNMNYAAKKCTVCLWKKTGTTCDACRSVACKWCHATGHCWELQPWLLPQPAIIIENEYLKCCECACSILVSHLIHNDGCLKCNQFYCDRCCPKVCKYCKKYAFKNHACSILEGRWNAWLKEKYQSEFCPVGFVINDDDNSLKAIFVNHYYQVTARVMITDALYSGRFENVTVVNVPVYSMYDQEPGPNLNTMFIYNK
jgi:hypothetical protein